MPDPLIDKWDKFEQTLPLTKCTCPILNFRKSRELIQGFFKKYFSGEGRYTKLRKEFVKHFYAVIDVA